MQLQASDRSTLGFVDAAAQLDDLLARGFTVESVSSDREHVIVVVSRVGVIAQRVEFSRAEARCLLAARPRGRAPRPRLERSSSP